MLAAVVDRILHYQDLYFAVAGPKKIPRENNNPYNCVIVMMRKAMQPFMTNSSPLLQSAADPGVNGDMRPATSGDTVSCKKSIPLFSVRSAGILFLFFILSHANAQGQLKTYLTAEAGPAWDVSRVQGGDGLFSRSVLYGSIAGIALWQEVLPNLSIGTGLYAHQYAGGLNPTDARPHQPVLKSHGTLLVPLRVSYRLQHPDFPVSLTARLGYEFGLRTNDPVSHVAASLVTNAEGVTVQYTMTDEVPVSNVLHMVEAGISADYRFTNNWQIAVQLSYFSGLRETMYATVDYTTSAGNSAQATYGHDGSRLQATLGLGIPVSNLWENRDVRLHRKVENSLGRGGIARSNRYIYFGGDLAALWRSFSTSNPAIGARSMEDNGIFRYANLRAGVFAGYMFNKVTGIDIGAYYQRSSLFTSVMYDHETDFAATASSPMFLDVPVMFRYYIDLHKRWLFLVPSVGGAVLTHFSGPGYASGNAAFTYQSISGITDGTASYVAGRPVRFGFAARASMGVEYDIPTPFPLLLTWNLTYSHGLRDLEVTEVITSLNETPEASNVIYDGSGWMTSIGVRLPFSLDPDNRKCGAMPRMRR